MIKTKFQVVSVSTSLNQEGVNIKLEPVPIDEQGGDNLSLFRGTSNGSISLFVTQASAISFFELGKRCSVVFEAE